MYLASVTRPDISFAMSKLSRFILNPRDNHWRAREYIALSKRDYELWHTIYWVPKGTRGLL
jgi:hypothetical protein